MGTYATVLDGVCCCLGGSFAAIYGDLDDDTMLLVCFMRMMCMEAWSSNAAIWSLSVPV